MGGGGGDGLITYMQIMLHGNKIIFSFLKNNILFVSVKVSIYALCTLYVRFFLLSCRNSFYSARINSILAFV
jgi:hypothetical protein